MSDVDKKADWGNFAVWIVIMVVLTVLPAVAVVTTWVMTDGWAARLAVAAAAVGYEAVAIRFFVIGRRRAYPEQSRRATLAEAANIIASFVLRCRL